MASSIRIEHVFLYTSVVGGEETPSDFPVADAETLDVSFTRQVDVARKAREANAPILVLLGGDGKYDLFFDSSVAQQSNDGGSFVRKPLFQLLRLSTVKTADVVWPLKSIEPLKALPDGWQGRAILVVFRTMLRSLPVVISDSCPPDACTLYHCTDPLSPFNLKCRACECSTAF